MNLREKVEEQLNLNSEMSCMDIAKAVQIDKPKGKYFPGEINTILRALIKKGKVKESDRKGPKGGKMYKINTSTFAPIPQPSEPVIVEKNKEEEPTMSARFIMLDVTDQSLEEATGTVQDFEEAKPKPVEMPENLEVGTAGFKQEDAQEEVAKYIIGIDPWSEPNVQLAPQQEENVVVEDIEVNSLPINFD